MPESPLIASLERTATHLAHILEDWSRDCDSQNPRLASSPDRKSITPPIETIYLAVQCLARLTAVNKTIVQLKSPNPIFCRPSSSNSPSAHSSLTQDSGPSPQSSFSDPSPSAPSASHSPSISSIRSIAPIRGVLTNSQLQTLLAATETLYTETASVAAERGIPMPTLEEIDSLALESSPSILDISRAVKQFHSDFKSLPQVPRSPPALC